MGYATQKLKCFAHGDNSAALERAATLLRKGELVAFPTETVYGLGADALNGEAVAKIFAAKQRPQDNPLIVHLADWRPMPAWCPDPGPWLEPLAGAFWPGPLTLVLPVAGAMRHTVCRGLDTVAVRVPEHWLARALIGRAGLALAAPSANLSGRPSPTDAQHVMDDLQGRIPLILDGGPCEIGIESTVLDLCGNQPLVLRPGKISVQALEAVLNTEVIPLKQGAQMKRSPGTRYRHYSPNAPVWAVSEAVSQPCFERLIARLPAHLKLGYLGWRELTKTTQKRLIHLPVAPSPEAMVHHFYRGLRALDARGAGLILVDMQVRGDLAGSLMDRLQKAASFRWDSDQQPLPQWVFEPQTNI